MKPILVVLFSLAFTNVALADIKLVVKDSRGTTSTIYSNGQQARVEGGKMPGYAIIDFNSGEILAIDTKRNEAVKMSFADASGTTAGNRVGVSLKDKGGGQKIAGYLTRKYEIIAGGEHCGMVYVSDKLLKNGDVSAVFQSMKALQNMTGGVSSRLSGMLSLCQRANLELGDTMPSSGAPMRVIDASGKLVSEVVSVDTDSKAMDYHVPAGLKVVSADEKIGQATQQMQDMPDMDQLMQQMEAAGEQMTPEMKQQMEQLQNMLQQLQQE
ncbi:MAG: hypothetical protein GY802_10690 [Gammaproteobacteria bacterium]|nr:hypothetical protein [Gammaproteobacteria bacterium]